MTSTYLFMCVIYYSQIGGNRRYIAIYRSDLRFISNRKTTNVSNRSRNGRKAIGSQRSFAAVYSEVSDLLPKARWGTT
jgi:hypothetical protein